MKGRKPSVFRVLRVIGALLGVLVSGCALENQGNDPVPGEFNFPLGIQMSGVADPSEAPSYLFVANSNFDLRYNAGTVGSYDLNALEATLEALRAAGQLPTDASGEPAVIQPNQLLRSQVRMGSHASAMALSPQGDRLYLSVRSDSNMTWIDVADGMLDCGGSGDFPICSDAHRAGDQATSNPRRVQVPTDPTGIAVGSASQIGLADEGDFVVMSHRAGQASLFIDRAAPSGGSGRSSAPLLVDVLDDLNIGQISARMSPNGITWMPTTDARSDRLDNFVDRVGVAADFQSPENSYLYNAGTARIEGINDGQDTRDIAFATAADGSNFAFILSRQPEALILVDLDQSTPSRLFVRDLVSVGYGPSRMKVVELPVGPAMEPRLFVFITCFDSSDIFVVDPLSGQTFTIARTLNGPYELEVDMVRRLMYVTDFRSSVIWIVTLEPLLECLDGTRAGVTCEPYRLASIGAPAPVKDLL